MSKNLLIVESPSKAKTIEKYLGGDWKVLATYGHIRELPSKSGSVEPENNFHMHYDIVTKAKKNIDAITDFIIANDNDVNLYLATDPDREGEAIAWHVIECIKLNKKIKYNKLNIKRAVFNAITKELIKEAIAKPRDIDQNLVSAQQSRLALDYLVGYTISPLLWRTVGGMKSSAGRVQSVALRLIVERELEIVNFKSEEYWSIYGFFQLLNDKTKNGGINSNLTLFQNKKVEKFTFTKESEVDSVKNVIESCDQYIINNIEFKKQQKHPYPPFTTASLQQEASRRLNFNAKRTMSIAQKLYEGVNVRGENIGLITYMRTDGVYITDDAIANIRNTIEDLYGKEYLHKDKRVYNNKIKNAQEAHEAIRPTNLNKNFSPEALKSFLSNEEYSLYNLIWKRTIASQMSSAAYDVTNVLIGNKSINSIYGENSIQFKSTFSNLTFDGFLAVYVNNDDEEEETKKLDLSKIKVNDIIDLKKVEGKQHFTEPPARYSEASLIKKMEEIGIGRPSTYATIITVLQTREYVTVNQKRFIPTIRGHVITHFLIDFFTTYFAYDFTANMENELDLIANGEEKHLDVLNNFWDGFYKTAQEISNTQSTKIITQVSEDMMGYLFSKNPDTGEIENDCKACKEEGRENGKLSLKFSRYGYFLGCSNYPECQFIKPLSDGIEQNMTGDQLLDSSDECIYQNDNVNVKLKKGRFGRYLEIEEGGKKRNVGISEVMFKELNQELIEKLIKLPMFIGNHPDDDVPVNLNLGPYGFYVAHGKSYASVGKGSDPFQITIEEALDLLIKQKAKIERNTKILESKKYGELKILKGGFARVYLIFNDEKKMLPKGIDFKDPDIDMIEIYIEKYLLKKDKPAKKASVRKVVDKKETIKSSSVRGKKKA